MSESTEFQNVWVFGGNGFIGKSIVESLKKRPRIRVINLQHKSLPGPDFEDVINITGGIEAFDICWFQRFKPHHIFHCARMAGGNPIMRNLASKRGQKANQKLVQALIASNYSGKLSYVSGSLMYGNSTNPFTESSPLQPIGFAKEYLKAEEPWLNAKQALDISFMRPGWILGPSSWFKAYFYDVYVKQGFVPYYGSGEQKMSIISLEDCAGLIVHASVQLGPSLDQNIFKAAPITQKEFSALAAGILGVPSKAVSLQEIESATDVHVAEALSSDCQLHTHHQQVVDSYTPKWSSLEQLLKQTIEQLSA